MRKGYLIMPKDFPGRKLLHQRLLEYPLSNSDDLVSALALLSTMVERKGQLPGLPVAEQVPYNLRVWNTPPDTGYWPNG